MASQTVAYVLWLFLGILGVHQFYLRRDRHAFVLWATLGGVCGLGWLRDYWHLPRYVDESNRAHKTRPQSNSLDDSYVNENDYSHLYVHESDDDDDYEINPSGNSGQTSSDVTVSYARFAGMLVMGLNFGVLVVTPCPQDWFVRRDMLGTYAIMMATSFAVALGVHVVANIGRLRTTLVFPLNSALFFSYCCWGQDKAVTIVVVSMATTITTERFGMSRKKRTRNRKRLRERLFNLALCGSVYLLLWGSVLYYNAAWTDQAGKEVRLRDQIDAFLSSTEWAAIQERMRHLSEDFITWFGELRKRKKEQKSQIRREFPRRSTDPYEVLGVDRLASPKEIKARYRTLVLMWHPDRQSDPQWKAEAHKIFIDIHNAYKKLSKRHM